MKELCKVKKIRRNIAYVEIERTDKCDGCKMCAFNKKKSITVPAKCDIKVELGQTVEVEMPTESVGGGALLIYAIPLVLMLAGVLIGLVGKWWLQLALCGAGLAIGLVCAWLIDGAYRKRAGVLPKVIATVNIDTDGAQNTANAIQSPDGETNSEDKNLNGDK